MKEAEEIPESEKARSEMVKATQTGGEKTDLVEQGAERDPEQEKERPFGVRSKEGEILVEEREASPAAATRSEDLIARKSHFTVSLFRFSVLIRNFP